MSADWEQFFQHTAAPADYENVSSSVDTWVRQQAELGRQIALVTSGGTTVPLEKNTVRFVDNFSIGTRGAASCEYFLQQGYAVVFLHRQSSAQPFARHLKPHLLLDAFLAGCGDREQNNKSGGGKHENNCGDDKVNNKNADTSVGGCVKSDRNDRLTAVLDETESNKLRPILQLYRSSVREGRLLSVPFTSLSSYIWLLKSTTLSLQQHSNVSSPALLYLAAAVADFYIPYEELSEHKLQSSSGPLSVQLQLVPKMLAPLVAIWGPSLYVVSFKLETDHTKLMSKAHAALQRYRHHLVVGNLLQTRRDEVTLVEPEEPKLGSTAATSLNPSNSGDDSSEFNASASNIKTKLLKLTEQEKQSNKEIELSIVEEICLRHRAFLLSHAFENQIKLTTD